MKRALFSRRALAALFFTIAFASCATLKGLASKFPSRIPDPTRIAPGLNDLTRGRVSPEAAALIKTVGPAAIEAVNAMAKAIEAYASQRRETEQREEEARRLHIASAQLFYADRCTQGAPAKDAAAGQPGAGTRGQEDAQAEAQADAAFASGDYASASNLIEKLYNSCKQARGDQDPELARLANKLAVAQLALGDPFRAMALAAQGLEIRKKAVAAAEKAGEPAFATLVSSSIDLAESQMTAAQIYRSAGELSLAESNSHSALDLRSKYLGNEHLCVAQAQNNLGELDLVVGNYPAALDLFEKSAAIRRKQLPEDHRDLAQTLNNMGSLYKATALFYLAERHYQKALENRLKLGEQHPEVADSYHNLASLYRAMGDLTKAESFYEKALAIRKAKLGEGLEVAQTETAYAELLASYGDYARALKLVEHAHAIRKTRLAEDHPDLAESLSDLAKIRQATFDFARAEQDAGQALAIWEKKLGPETLAVANALSALGDLYLAQAKLPLAEAKLRDALKIREAKLGPDHPAVAESLHQLGTLTYAQSDYARSEPLLRRAIDIRKAKLGNEAPETASSLSYLAALLVATDRPADALKAFVEAQRISEQLIRTVGSMASESRLDALLRFLRSQEDVVYSLLQEPSTASGAAPFALAVALLRKGRSVDESAGLSQAVYQGLGEEDKAKFNELRLLHGQIARQKLSPTAWKGSESTEALAEKADAIEQQLAQRSAAIRSRQALPSIDEIVSKTAEALPVSTALVEVVKYRPYQFKAKPSQPRWGDMRYAVLVLDGGGRVTAKDLGAAATVDETVKALLAQITADTAEGKGKGQEEIDPVREAGKTLDRLVIEPIREPLGKNKRMALSLDGQLNLVPFWALFDGKDFLIDRFEITYVTSGRDLLRAPAAKRARTVAILAKPAFVKGDQGKVAPVEKGSTRGFEVVADPSAPMLGTRVAPGALKLTAVPSPLPGTEEEARAIKQLLPAAKLALGSEATKERFLGLQAPGILHVATHGLFRPGTSNSTAGSRGLELMGAPLVPAVSATPRADPLLSSMLLWAHVTTPVSSGGSFAAVLEPDGLATSLEVAGMNLWGTQLVVLSACETGRGHVDDLGQGVYGLRRAVMVAGAETLVTSLWKVDDQVTRSLMTAFYKNLLSGLGRAEALRRAALQIRKKHPEPRYWAPFIAIGQADPLKGIH